MKKKNFISVKIMKYTENNFIRNIEKKETLKDSINKALEQVPSSGMKLVKILEIAEEYYQHSIDRPYVNKVLIDNNFAYDEENQVWKRVLG